MFFVFEIVLDILVPFTFHVYLMLEYYNIGYWYRSITNYRVRWASHLNYISELQFLSF